MMSPNTQDGLYATSIQHPKFPGAEINIAFETRDPLGFDDTFDKVCTAIVKYCREQLGFFEYLVSFARDKGEATTVLEYNKVATINHVLKDTGVHITNVIVMAAMTNTES